METTKVLIVGGGINGAGVFRDLALHGVDSILIEKGDFASQTSQSSSKMLHGGIRYLENFDFELVKEALHEKNLWKKIAPHLTRELPFFLPIYKHSKDRLSLLKLGLTLYDFLSNFENSPHYLLSSKASTKEVVGLNPKDLKGSGVYYDVILDDAKLTLEVIYDALRTGVNNSARSYTELIDLHVCTDHVIAKTKDQLTGEVKEIRANECVFTTGPFTDQLFKDLGLGNDEKLLPSKGIHIWISNKDLPLRDALVMRPSDGRIIFVIPHRHAVLVGTTETKPDADFFNIRANQNEVDYLLQNLKGYFPNLNITNDSILASYAGIRPLVKAESGELGKTSRVHKVYRPFHHLYVLLGGKLTTFRAMVTDVTRPIVIKNGHPYSDNRSKSPLVYKSVFHHERESLPTKNELRLIFKNEMPRTFNDLVTRRLSIPSKKYWHHQLKADFDTYFREHMSLINEYIKFDEQDLNNFPHF